MIKILIIIATLGIFHTPSYEYMVEHITDSASLEYYFSYFDYRRDKTWRDEWKTPMEFYNNGGGDCEDFAVFGYEMLTGLGYECTIYSIDNEEEEYSHAILVYYGGDDCGYFSNYRREEGYYSIGEILKKEGYESWDICDWRQRRKNRVRH